MCETRNSSLFGKITILFVICCCCLSVQAKYGGGNGTAEDPYLIYTAEQMNEIGLNESDWWSHFKLMADIDLFAYTGTSFNIIGYYIDSRNQRPFSGVFDGNGHTISNFTYTSTDVSYIGLFGYVHGSDAKIKNLGLIDPNVDAGTGRFVGLLVGRLRRGTIMNCYVENGCVAGDRTVGGLVGENYISTVTNCYSSSSVTGTKCIGGLVGLNYSSEISNCCSEGIVSGSQEVGGLVGSNRNGTISKCYSSSSVTGTIYTGGLTGRNRDGTITNSYSTGSVLATSRVGGLVGWNMDTITNCYSSSSVSGDERVGGLVGDHDWDGTITNCYSTGRVMGDRYIGGLVGYKGLSDEVFTSFWDIETSGQTASAGGTPKTTAEMQTANTFVLWVCPPVWTIDEGLDYPRLWWENKPGEPIKKHSYGGGSGETNAPYLIYTAEQLNTIGLIVCDLDKHFKLMADIDLSAFTGTSFNIIGTRQPWRPFSGVFDGNGHTISNFTYISTGTDYIGLFGYVYVHDSDAQIKNLGLIDPNVDVGTGSVVGSLVGWLRDSTITNCYVDGGSVSGNSYVGGLVGTNDGTINNCYATGSISGDTYLGGLAGHNRDTITNCYSAGSVSGISNVGGLLGRNASYGKVMHSFWDIETSGQATSAGGTGLPTDQMQIARTFINADWDFETVWDICENSRYPHLWWELPLPPLANAGHDQFFINVIPPKVILEGSSSCNALSYHWRQVEGPSVILENPENALASFVPMEWGVYIFELSVSDGQEEDTDMVAISFGERYAGGTGTAQNPCQIRTAEQMNEIGLHPEDWDRHFIMMEDIDLSAYHGTSFNIIGTYPANPFTGVFDGSGRTISNFTYDSTGTNYIGLFGYVEGADAEIKNLGLIDPNVDAETGGLVGSLVGYIGGNGTIRSCYARSVSIVGSAHIGGLVGMVDGATIHDCYVTGSVVGLGGFIGGLVGDVLSIEGEATIHDCYAIGSVTGYDSVGGLAGGNEGTITNCYSTHSVTGKFFVGGLVGQSPGTITNCYSTSSVAGEWDVGGLVGANGGAVTASFWDIETSGQDWSDGGTGLPTDQMQTMSTFTDAGWDFVGETVNGIEDIWFIPQGDYPHLWWEGMQVPMKMTPRTLNCRSYGNWVKAHLTLPQGFTVADVNSDRPAVMHSLGYESAPLYVFVNKDKLVEIEAAFEREAVCSLAGDWPQMLTVAGFLADGNIFLGTSNVRIIHPGMKVIEELAWYWLNADCVQPDFCNEIDMNRDSLVNLLDYALLMNIEVEFVTDE